MATLSKSSDLSKEGQHYLDRKSVVQGKSVDLGGRRIIKKKKVSKKDTKRRSEEDRSVKRRDEETRQEVQMTDMRRST